MHLHKVPYPTTLILLAIVAAVVILGVNKTVDGAAVTSILGSVVGAVTVGHYVKTSNGTTTITRHEAGGADVTLTRRGPPRASDEPQEEGSL